MSKEMDKKADPLVSVGRISQKDVALTAFKLQQEKDGDYTISGFSIPAIRYNALEFLSQLREDRSRGGVRTAEKKKKENYSRNQEMRELKAKLIESGKTPRNVAAIVASRFCLSVDHTRKILKPEE